MPRPLLRLRGIVFRLLLSAVTTAAILAVALSGMFVAMAPRLISESIEPLSLLLLPGLLFAIASVGPHDFKPDTVVKVAALFWFVTAFFFLTWRAHTRS